MGYYYALNGETLGPLPVEDLVKVIDANTFVWNENGSIKDWISARDVQEIASKLIDSKKFTPPPPPQQRSSLSTGQATLCIYRPFKFIGGGGELRLYTEDYELCRIGSNKAKTIHIDKEGPIRITIVTPQFGGSDIKSNPQLINFKFGETYYLKVDGMTSLYLMEPTIGKAEFNKYKLQ